MSAKTDISRMPSQRSSQSVDYVGFSNFPNQVFRRCIKNGFEFTIMVVGQSGLGKSTFLNSLFLAEIHDVEKESFNIPSTVSIESKTTRMVENDVRLTITFVDTPGFGDLIDNSKCWDPIVQYIDDKFTEYLNEETKVDRPAVIPDKRVHLCLYFIAPTGHRLKALDIECMRALQKRVNIVPVIAKADTLTPDELAKFKKNIVEDLAKNKIELYLFPGQEKNEPVGLVEERKSQLANGNVATPADLLKRIPFAVVGSNRLKEIDRRRQLRVREYPWGIVEVDNMAHNDFVALRDLIIRNHMIDLIDVTKVVHYENFRMRQMGSNPKNTSDNDPFTQLEQERKASEASALEMRKAKERIFVERVAERERVLLEKAQALDALEKKREQELREKKDLLNRLAEELAELRQGKVQHNSTLTDSGSSINSERSKKKGTLSLFNRH